MVWKTRFILGYTVGLELSLLRVAILLEFFLPLKATALLRVYVWFVVGLCAISVGGNIAFPLMICSPLTLGW